MSKLSFRARALDPSKHLNIHIAEELPDLTEYSAINRAVPQMPSGMEKEEESEHHLQRAICTGLIIPTPEVFDIDQEFYDRIYPEDFKISRQLIRMQPLGIEQDIPDYDMDSADEAWIDSQNRRFDLSPLKFEEMMDRLEKSSGQTVVTLNEAKALLKQDDEISIAVYDYWLNKRLTTQHPLILTIKTENRAGSAVNNPYIAFRRRTEKMQTRKNRKNDETSYEKMLKLKRNLSRAVTLLEMIKRREKTKREHVHLGIEIFEKRYQAKDFNGCLLNEFTNNAVKSSRSAFAPLYGNQYAGQQSNQYWSNSGYATGANSSSLLNKHGNNDMDGVLHNNNRKEKRQYKKRKHKNQREKQPAGSTIDHLASSDEDEPIINLNHLGHDAENEGLYPFRRSSSSQYQRPTQEYGYWPWETKNEKSAKYRFTLTSIRHPRVRCIGFSRRRRGRGGRIVLDRISTNMDEFWANLDYTIYSGNQKITAKELTQQNELKNQQQLTDIVQDKPTSVVIDLEPPQPSTPSSSNQPVSLIQTNSGNSENLKIVSSRDGTENIVINIDEKTKVTVGESLDTVNRTKNDIANAFIEIKTIESRMKTDSNVNKDNNNNSGNSNNSSIVMYKGNTSGLSSNSLRNHISDSANDLSAALQQNHDAFTDDKYVTNQLYSELFGDWLHFRPKTPDEDIDMFNFGEDFPQFAENASLAVDIQRLTENNLPSDQCNDVAAPTSSAIGYGKLPIKQLIDQTVDHTFTTNPFTYDYVTTTTPKVEPYSSDSSSLPKSDDESSVDDIAGISHDLSLGDNEANDKAIDTLLEECKFDDLKSNAFWNGLLDENGSLLDVIDNKKPLNKNKDEIDDVSDLGLSSVLSSAANIDRKPIRRRPYQQPKMGHSTFNVANLHRNERPFSKSNANETASRSGATVNSDENRTNLQEHQSSSRTKNDGSVAIIDSTVKKELVDGDANEDVSGSSNFMKTGGIQVKDEPMDELIASSVDEQSLHARQQIVPVIKTEIGNNVPIVSNTALQRPIAVQHGAHIQQQSHQQAFATNDQTLILASRPIRRLTTNGPGDNKAVQHLLINRKFQMIQQRPVAIVDDEKDVKPKILEGTYLKLPTDFNVVSSNALTQLNASSATSKHNYSLPPQSYHTPITLIGQSQQSQNKVIINPNGQVDYHEISELPRNFHDVHRDSKNVKITIPTSNIKLNIVPSLAQVMQSGSVLIDAKSGTVGGTIRNDMNQTSQQQQQQQQQQGIEQSVSVATASTSSPNVTQIHYQQPMQQQQSQQQKVTPHSRILYTNLKNNRGGTQFLAQINPTKVVNILPIQHKGNANTSTVQGIVNKALRSVVVSSSQSQNQQLATAFQRQSANANSNQANALMGTNAGSGTLFITTSSASDPSSIINCSINTNVNQNSVLVGNSSLAPVTDATLLNLNHNDGNATTINR